MSTSYATETYFGGLLETMRVKVFDEWLARCPNVGPHGPSIAFVFSDIVGSTTLLFELGDDPYDEILRSHVERAKGLIDQLHGLLIDTAGDGIFCVFNNTPEAFVYAQDLWADPGDSRIGVRLGLHYGLAKSRGDSFCGRTVHFASRVMGKATNAEIWLSDSVKQTLESSLPAMSLPKFERHPECVLKNIPFAVTLWRVVLE